MLSHIACEKSELLGLYGAKLGQTSSGIGPKFSLTYPTEGGISALLLPENNVW